MNINWYPGHMKKAKESIKKNLSLVDLVYEVIDARIPYSSRNPEIDNIIGDRPRLIILNKSGLADEKANLIWEEYFKSKGILAISVDSLNNKGIDDIISLSYKLTKDKRMVLEKKKA